MKDFKTLNFLMSPELQQLKSVLIDRSNEEFRFVGGCVRDALLLVKANDIDICTTSTPEGVIKLARSNRLQVVPTGLKHGTVSVIVNGIPFEITTLRVDTETDGRHAIVRWTKSFEEDASRRDFTYNAMSIDFEGNFYDYFDGVKDLRFCNTVFVGDAIERIREDYLRVLRYFRFVARFNSPIDDNILCLMHYRQVKEGLAQISKERVWAEMSKLLMFSSRYRVMQALFNCGIAAVIGLDYAPQTLLNAADDAVAALASFELTIDNAKALASDWKLSTVERTKLVWLVANKDKRDKLFMQDSLVDGIDRSWVLSHAQLRATCVNEAKTFEPPIFPVTGKDLISLGFEQGIHLGSTLQSLRKFWMDSRFTLTKDDLIKLI